MNTEALKNGFLDELTKISVSLAGLSPQTLLSQRAPEPLETPGSQRALQILDLAKEKTAGMKEIALSGVGGGGLGAFASTLGVTSPWATSWAMKDPKRAAMLSNLKWAGTVAGTALGAGRQVAKEHKAKKEQAAKTASMISPAMQLRTSKQVAVPSSRVNNGPVVKTQIRGTLIGRKGQLP